MVNRVASGLSVRACTRKMRSPKSKAGLGRGQQLAGVRLVPNCRARSACKAGCTLSRCTVGLMVGVKWASASVYCRLWQARATKPPPASATVIARWSGGRAALAVRAGIPPHLGAVLGLRGPRHLGRALSAVLGLRGPRHLGRALSGVWGKAPVQSKSHRTVSPSIACGNRRLWRLVAERSHQNGRRAALSWRGPPNATPSCSLSSALASRAPQATCAGVSTGFSTGFSKAREVKPRRWPFHAAIPVGRPPTKVVYGVEFD